jgi:hypothetical protein
MRRCAVWVGNSFEMTQNKMVAVSDSDTESRSRKSSSSSNSSVDASIGSISPPLSPPGSPEVQHNTALKPALDQEISKKLSIFLEDLPNFLQHDTVLVQALLPFLERYDLKKVGMIKHGYGGQDRSKIAMYLLLKHAGCEEQTIQALMKPL